MTDLNEQFDISPEFCDRYCQGKAWPLPRHATCPPPSPTADKYDIVIAGAGPAGLLLRLLLARYGFGEESVLCVDSNAQQTNVGHADGIHGRTVEVLASLGLEHEIITQGRLATERSVWEYSEKGLHKTRQDAFDFGPTRFGQLYLIHQGRLERVLRTDLKRYVKLAVQYSTLVTGAHIDETDPAFPVVIDLQEDTKPRSVRARYLIGADGAHSVVRNSLDIPLKGDTIDEIFGVVDFVPQTNFPDVRRMVSVASGTKRISAIIPREKLSSGDWLSRIYINMTEDLHKENVLLRGEQRDDIRRKKASITKDLVLKRIAEIYQPYTMAVKPGTQPVWWATYSIGQRLAETFHIEDSTSHPRVFLVGDACHTHSPHQGQGVNIGMADAYYLAWRLAYVLNDLSPDPASLLRTYTSERFREAQRVVNSDKRWNQSGLHWSVVIQEMREQVIGVGVEEPPSLLIADENDGVAWQEKILMSGVLRTGRRLFNVRVRRYADNEIRDIHDDFVSDGRYRILLLASDDFPHGRSSEAVTALLSMVRDFSDQLVELVVLQPNSGKGFRWEDVPVGLKDHAEMRVFCADSKVYETYCVDPKEGAVALVRPDGMVAITTKLEDVGKVRGMLLRVLKPVSTHTNGTAH